MKCAGLIYDDSFHYIDHLAPFCSLLGCPLFVCDPNVADLCRIYYPALHLIEVEISALKQQLPEWIIACDPYALLTRALGGFLPLKFRMIWLPHGQSDKGWKHPFFEALQQENLLLVYGQKMRDVLHTKGIFLPQISVGNFRKRYFERHRSFYEQLMNQKLGQKRVILYAPTWEDSEQNGTLWQALHPLIQKMGDELLVKPHPNTARKFKMEIARTPARFLEDFPPIYPLLERTDIYFGDMSSIGYDFLAFERPLFFLRSHKTDPLLDPSAFLMRCGEQILMDELTSLSLSASQEVDSKRALFAYAFDFSPDFPSEINAWLSTH